MDYKELYKLWTSNSFFDQATREELKNISDEEEIKDRFYQNLAFGTAGLRGKLGAGTNRMNEYTVGLASQGFAKTILENSEDGKERGVAICYDVRHRSKEFSELAARVFAANGIRVYLSKDIQPTPFLSYAIRNLNTIAGVMVTASHNPKDYNGYKAYWQEGSQILEDIACKIEANINSYDFYDQVKKISLEEGIEKGLISYIEDELYQNYLADVLKYALSEDLDKDIKIVYSPLNGTGNKPVRETLKRRGFTNINIVTEQENPDPDFLTVGYPNPEDPKAFKYSEELGKKIGADILLATDPDCDRCAMEVKRQDGSYEFVNGNKIGALLVNYILARLDEKKALTDKGVIVKSIVTGDLSRAIAEKYKIETIETLTGFKNICGKANEFEKTGEKEFIFGYEESIGYTYGTSVRDKDAVNSSMMIAEMASYYKKRGKSLLDVLEDIYKEFGYYNEDLISIVLTGLDGQALIKRIMEEFRKNPISELGEIKLVKTIDYLFDQTGNPKSNVLKYYYDDKSWFALRPSGTEPKIKLYVYSVADSKKAAEEKISLIKNAAVEKIESVE